VWLRLNKPRRAITLDETEHGQLDCLKTLAEQVARILVKPLSVLTGGGVTRFARGPGESVMAGELRVG